MGIDTTNGVEAQNKILKYNYLPRRKHLTLSGLVSVLIEEFVPDIHHKYMFQNYQMSPTYRSYNDIVPQYLHGCPRPTILHCLERKSNSRKFNSEDILSKDTEKGVFTIQGSSGYIYTVNFGNDSLLPSCSCSDWTKWQLPCKHFFAVFRLVPEWSWESLPESYRKSAYLSTNHTSLPEYQVTYEEHATHESGAMEVDVLDDETVQITSELPCKKVSPVFLEA